MSGSNVRLKARGQVQEDAFAEEFHTGVPAALSIIIDAIHGWIEGIQPAITGLDHHHPQAVDRRDPQPVSARTGQGAHLPANHLKLGRCTWSGGWLGRGAISSSMTEGFKLLQAQITYRGWQVAGHRIGNGCQDDLLRVVLNLYEDSRAKQVLLYQRLELIEKFLLAADGLCGQHGPHHRHLQQAVQTGGTWRNGQRCLKFRDTQICRTTLDDSRRLITTWPAVAEFGEATRTAPFPGIGHAQVDAGATVGTGDFYVAQSPTATPPVKVRRVAVRTCMRDDPHPVHIVQVPGGTGLHETDGLPSYLPPGFVMIGKRRATRTGAIVVLCLLIEQPVPHTKRPGRERLRLINGLVVRLTQFGVGWQAQDAGPLEQRLGQAQVGDLKVGRTTPVKQARAVQGWNDAGAIGPFQDGPRP
jgi:hypothetical protein